ncbi:hypothetical protein [Streptomyces vietnamensis]|uniref:Uncharacterized protein n=1 Tax=Streptomyces vietnamensis TaxID=362257 RepID=A0A0B5IHY4_9ACTN|nr:hypothetical protein [Streptomyces vietnamensis]AJF67969.1 hypothetical protein SVTN_29950 [Streptomyces vietnamensis]
MLLLAWGVFATAFGWIVVTDFRGAAHRLHAMSRAATPFGGAGAPNGGVGFLRFLAGVFALVGPFVLGSGLLDLWRGAEGPGEMPSPPVEFVVVEAIVAGVFLWRMWRRSGLLRREWDAGTGLRRAAVAGLSVAIVAFVVTLGAGWGTWMMTSWLVGGLCGIGLLVAGRTGQGA